MLIPGKNYFFFSHTRKLQLYNQKLMQSVISKKITLIDYECLEHEDGTRLIGFGFFAGVVGRTQWHDGLRKPHRKLFFDIVYIKKKISRNLYIPILD